jgi:hypothetical protein
MKNNKMIIDTELDIIQYVNCVDNIVSKFFNDELDYEPSIGMLHTMCIFYNLCVKDSKFKDSIGDEVHDIWDIRDVAKDAEFIKEFNNAISKTDIFCLNFNNAYKQAMDIVERKKNPVSNILDIIKDLGIGLSESVGELLNIGSTIAAEADNEENTDVQEDVSVVES